MHHLERQRREKRAAVAALGLDPYGSVERGVVDLARARAMYDAAADEQFKADATSDRRPQVTVGGRVMLHRDNGRLVWMNLRDATGDLQVAVSERDCSARGFRVAKLTDLGDLVVAEGPLTQTRTGEITVWARDVRPAAKCLVPPPEKWAGLADVELRYRQRYVDLWANADSARVFRVRTAIVSGLRRFLDRRGFEEVETPMLQVLPGGAAARPFVTRMHALGLNLYLRVAPELYLKRVLVGGLPRVYEINRSFRNEGLDRQHNPEFTMVEAYEAFGDCGTMMALVEEMVREAAGVAAGLLGGDVGAMPFGPWRINYVRPFRRVEYAELFREALGFDMRDTGRVRREIVERGLAQRVKGAAWGENLDPQEAERRVAQAAPALLINTLFEHVAERRLDPATPTFVTGYPAAISPLTRPRSDDLEIAERADLFIGGMELAPMYTELNDPDVQAEKFRQQLEGLGEEEQTFRTFDEDFIRALKVGMPPAGGMGLGVDRLVMLLTNQRTIRDVILFPLLRAESERHGVEA